MLETILVHQLCKIGQKIKLYTIQPAADKKFYEAKANFAAIQAHNSATLYQTFNAGTLGASNANLQAMLVEVQYFLQSWGELGSSAKSHWRRAVNTFDTAGSGANNKYAKIGSVVYEAKQDFSRHGI